MATHIRNDTVIIDEQIIFMSASLKDKAQFYQKLYMGVKSGLTPEQILTAGVLPPSYADRADKLRVEIDKGVSFTEAFSRAGLVTGWEATLIHIGEQSGKMESVLSQLDAFFSTKVLQLGAIKSRLVYPLMIILVAIIVTPLPALASGLTTAPAYLFRVLVSLGIVYGVYRYALVRPFEKASMGAFNPLLIKSLALVGDKHFLRLVFEIAYLDLLSLCLESGMDAGSALKLMKSCSPNRKYQKRHLFTVSNVEKSGSSLSSALTLHEIISHPTVVSFLVTSERTGTLHSDLREFVIRMKGEISGTLDYYIRRISALFYLAAMVIAVARIF